MPAPASHIPNHAPSQLFFTSASQRVALARERFFDRGERPTGLVSEAIIQSWTRCLAARRATRHAVAFDPVTRSRLHATLERSRALLQAAQGAIDGLEAALAGTGASVLLTDASGVILHSTPRGAQAADGTVLQLAGRVGVNLSEQHVGTNAPAVVVKTGVATTVLGAEHYFECVRPLHCAAAPVHNGQGRLAGVLDITVEAQPFSFDAAALVGVYATMIENRLLQATAQDQLVLQFQVCSSLLGSTLEGLVGVDSQGRLAWHNGTAQQLLGLGQRPAATAAGGADAARQAPAVETVFGASAAQLQARVGSAAARPLRLPNGLTVWLRARLSGPAASVATHDATHAATPDPAQDAGASTVPSGDTFAPAIALPPPADALAGDGAAAALSPDPSASTSPATLGQATGDVIARTLAACHGNISRAARQLGVSRGLLYRHLRNAGTAPGLQAEHDAPPRGFPDALPT